MNKRTTALLTALFAATTVVGCERSPRPAADEPTARALRLAINPVPQAALVILALENGYFREEGLDVQVSTFTTGKLAFDAVLGGAADLATVADMPIMLAIMAGHQPAVLATIERSGESVKILARRDRGVATASDLRGKRIATFKASSAEFFLDRFLQSHGMTQRDVQVVHLQPPDMVAAFARGDVAAISIWEPHIHNARAQVATETVVFARPDVYTETFNIAGRVADLTQRRSDFEAFLRGLVSASRFLSEEPARALEVVASYTQMDLEVLRAIWPAFDLSLGLDETLSGLLREEAEFSIETGVIARRAEMPDFGAALFPDPLRAAKAARRE